MVKESEILSSHTGLTRQSTFNVKSILPKKISKLFTPNAIKSIGKVSHYLLLKKLGAGGFGTAFKALNLKT